MAELQYCPMCGASNESWAVFCRGCGFDLRSQVAREDMPATVTMEKMVPIEEEPASFLRWLFNPSPAIVPKLLVFLNQAAMAVWSLWVTGTFFLQLLRIDPLGVSCFLYFFFPLVFLPMYWYGQSMALLYGIWQERWNRWLKIFASTGVFVGSNLLWVVFMLGLEWAAMRLYG